MSSSPTDTSSSLVWFLLVDEKGMPFKGAGITSVTLAPTSIVDQFRDAVKSEFAGNRLKDVDPVDLQVYANKAAFEAKEKLPLKRSGSLVGLGISEDNPIYVMVPPAVVQEQAVGIKVATDRSTSTDATKEIAAQMADQLKSAMLDTVMHALQDGMSKMADTVAQAVYDGMSAWSSRSSSDGSLSRIQTPQLHGIGRTIGMQEDGDEGGGGDPPDGPPKKKKSNTDSYPGDGGASAPQGAGTRELVGDGQDHQALGSTDVADLLDIFDMVDGQDQFDIFMYIMIHHVMQNMIFLADKEPDNNILD